MIRAVDLFCGAGGVSSGLKAACDELGRELDLVGVNHWPLAIETFRRNHPWAREPICKPVDAVDPRKAVPSGKVDLITAGVECTHHSRARGGRPVCDQSRSSAWHVLHWAEQLRAEELLIENVPEFLHWGPLDEKLRPIREKRGTTFLAWVQALESLGYHVDRKVLNSADYGDPQARKRLFVRASRRGRPAWPEPTHAAPDDAAFDPQLRFASRAKLEPWRTAREVIDWGDLGTSIFRRPRPLKPRTLARIRAGIERFCGDPWKKVFLDALDDKLERLPEIPQEVVAEPFIVPYYRTGVPKSIDQPLPTITTKDRFGLVTPFILPHDQWVEKNGEMVDSLDEPLRTITASNGSCNYLVAPFVVPHFGERPTQAPRTHSLDEPMPTVTASKGAGSLVQPFLVKFYGKSTVSGVDQPIPTVTAQGEHLGLCSPLGTQVGVDILFRMFTPRELARGQSFPDSFEFLGGKGDQVRQIGNAVPGEIAKSLTSAAVQSILAREAA